MADTETIHAPTEAVTTVLSAPKLPTGTGPTIPAPPECFICQDLNNARRVALGELPSRESVPRSCIHDDADNDRCEDCNGCGTRSAQMEWNGTVQDGERECDTCNGTGHWCTECLGTGVVIEGTYGGKVVYVNGCPKCGREC
jgi:hypothetical protein